MTTNAHEFYFQYETGDTRTADDSEANPATADKCGRGSGINSQAKKSGSSKGSSSQGAGSKKTSSKKKK